MKIKIYEFETDWVAAKSKKEAIEFYSDEIDSTGDEVDCKELSESEMDRLVYIDDIDDPDNSPKRSFREQLTIEINNGEEFPELFASSEY